MRSRAQRPIVTAAACASALAVAFAAGVARSKPICAQTLPSPLVTFCAGAPVLATEINGNFLQLASWLSLKAGRPSDASFIFSDCVKPDVNVYFSGGAASIVVDGGDATCGPQRSPIAVSCNTSNAAATLDAQGIALVNGSLRATCHAKGGATTNYLHMNVTCCRFQP